MKNEKLVTRAMKAVESFVSRFADDDRDLVVILLPGAAAAKYIEKDVLKAEKVG